MKLSAGPQVLHHGQRAGCSAGSSPGGSRSLRSTGLEDLSAVSPLRQLSNWSSQQLSSTEMSSYISAQQHMWWRLTATALSPRVKKMKLKVETLEQPDCLTTRTGCPEAARLQELPICSRKTVFRQLPPTVLGLHPLSWQLPKLHALTGFFPHRCSKSLFFTSYSTLIFSWPWVGTSHVSQANGSATHYTSMLTKGHFQT